MRMRLVMAVLGGLVLLPGLAAPRPAQAALGETLQTGEIPAGYAVGQTLQEVKTLVNGTTDASQSCT
jgi:hypothetical protein